MNREVCGRLKADIHQYQDGIITEVEEYSADLMATKEELDNSKVKVHRWLKDKHVSEQLHQRQEMCKEIEKHLERMVDKWRNTTNLPSLVFPSK